MSVILPQVGQLVYGNRLYLSVRIMHATATSWMLQPGVLDKQ